MSTDEEMLVFAGSGSPQLTAKICQTLAISVRIGEVVRFSDGNLMVRIGENVRGRHVYLVQLMPYFSYAKGDKKDEPRVAIRARVCADAIQVAGADRVVTLDLHAAQIQGFFTVPVDDLYALPVLVNALRDKKLVDPIVVSPDVGFAKKAR